MTKNAWEILPNESPRAFHNFRVYRDMGQERSIRKAGKKLAKNAKSLGRQSVNYRWQERALAYDQHIDRQRQLALQKEIDESVRMDLAYAKKYEQILSYILSEVKNELKISASGARKLDMLLRCVPRLSKAMRENIEIKREAFGIDDQENYSIPLKRNDAAEDKERLRRRSFDFRHKSTRPSPKLRQDGSLEGSNDIIEQAHLNQHLVTGGRKLRRRHK